ncbi:voltage-gated monoatomic cation channel TMEM109 [Brachionichthys hirsutus]|uniref:voltage-gated monoatomic cation channel TMEM109 n=1 Tax=Brachionichthys hirsutus TaxID=412623 RepID=UPI00360475DE
MLFCASGSGRGGGHDTRRLFLPICVLVFGLALGWAGAEAGGVDNPSVDGPSVDDPAVVTLRTLVTGACQEVHRYAQSAVGSGVMRSAAQFFKTVIRFLAEGAASGLNVIAVYVTEILRVTGFDVARTMPRFTPEGVTAIAQWGLVTLIGYWLLTVILQLLICVVGRVFWLVKALLALCVFGLIVTDRNASTDTTAVRLGVLVLGCVILTLLTSGSEKTLSVDRRLTSLEGRLRAVEKRKAE